jgi:serine O-acetyltransferase
MDAEIKNKLKKITADALKCTASGVVEGAKGAVRVGKGVKKLVGDVREDVAAVRERDPAARSELEVLLLYSGVHALAAHRVAHELYKSEHYFSARAISQIARMFTGVEIHPGATIGKGFVIDHGAGVVIGETTEIGDNCTIYQGATLGGTGKDVGKRHPTIGNNVMIGAGAKVLGPFYIGDNSKVAANAVVLKEIPENCTAVGIPAKVVRREGVKIAEQANKELDHIHIPDPVAQELRKLEERIAELEAELKKKEEEK